jgi:methionine-rich copper-binding protein CopC
VTAALLGLVLGIVLVALGPVTSAGAHAVLVGSDPEAESVVAVAPEVVRLRFDEPVRPGRRWG